MNFYERSENKEEPETITGSIDVLQVLKEIEEYRQTTINDERVDFAIRKCQALIAMNAGYRSRHSWEERIELNECYSD